MRRIAKLLSFVPVALVFAACDSADQMTAPQYRAQTESATATSGMTKFDGMAAGKGAAGANRVYGSGFGNIGADGGTVQLWASGKQIGQLVVPAGAVDRNTLFSLLASMQADGKLAITASAQSQGKNVTKFGKPLGFYYNPGAAAIVKSLPPGLALRASTTTETGTFISTPLAQAGSGPGNPPPGDGWVYVETEDFTGWIIIL